MSQPPFAAEEWAFLRTILDMPEDRNTWLVYADWLDDRGDPRAEFLRLMVARSLMSADDPARPPAEARLKQLRAELDPQWVMVFDGALVGNCYHCWWVDMTPTDVPDIRICRQCRNAVIYAHTLEEARVYASCGQRVALSTRIPNEEVECEPAFELPGPAPFDDAEEFELWLAEFRGLGPPPPAPPPDPPRPS